MKIKILLNVCLALACSACLAITDSQPYKDSRKFYYTHINKPAVVDFSVAEISPIDSRLTKTFAALDKELTNLERELDGILDINNVQAITNLFSQFPWISHIYALSPEGEVMGAIPSYVPDNTSFYYIQEREVKAREIIAEIEENPMGHEIVLFRPYMLSGELQAFLAVTFDPKSLLPFVGDPSHVVFLSEKVPFWTGDFAYEDTPFALDWEKVLKSSSYDTVSNDQYEGAWIVRYYGGQRLVYGVLQEKGQEE